MSTDYTNEIGYESLLADFKRYQKQTPRGVGIKRTGRNIYLQFKTPNTGRKTYACNCNFTLDGMVEALKKSKLVKEQLENLTSEVEFWAWYDKEIKNESQLVDDQVTFIQAITEVKRDFWNRPSRTGRERDKSSSSDQASWYRSYGVFFQHLPDYTKVNLDDIMKVINMQKKGTKNYGEVVSSMKKLVEINKRKDIYLELSELDVVQTIFAKLQSINLEEFIAWRDEVLGVTSKLHKNCNIDSRRDWMWVFSTQIVYCLRLNEVFAIKNLTEPYVTKDGVSIPALNDLDNTDNLIYVGDKTNLGTTVKTGARVARPQIPPKYPNLIEELDIKRCKMPANKPRSSKATTVRGFHVKEARSRLLKWNAPYTQTHADRHLGNINGIQAGIPQEVRAMSMGHTSAMNDNGYKNRIGTQTKIDLLLNSNQNAIDFVSAMAQVKKLVSDSPEQKQFAAKLLSVIYQKGESEISELL